jgi:hypothetical protein
MDNVAGRSVQGGYIPHAVGGCHGINIVCVGGCTPAESLVRASIHLSIANGLLI